MKSTRSNRTHALIAGVLLCAFAFSFVPSVTFAQTWGSYTVTDGNAVPGGGNAETLQAPDQVGGYPSAVDSSTGPQPTSYGENGLDRPVVDSTGNGSGGLTPTGGGQDPTGGGTGGLTSPTGNAGKDATSPYGKAGKPGGTSAGGGSGGNVQGSGQPVQDRALIQMTRKMQADLKKIQANTKKSAAMNTISAKKLGSLEKKEYILDGILHTIVKKVTQQLVKSALQWIGSGFKGAPMFVTDPGQFLLSASDQVAKEFIYGSGLNSSCSPTNVRTALDKYYRNQTGRTPGSFGGGACSLTGALGNSGGTGGTFGSATGGWGNWFAALSNPTNTTLGGFVSAQQQLDQKIASKQRTESQKWDWGKGFIPKEECTTVNGEKTCKTTTPGETIAQATNFDLSIGKRELISADELNEIISALMSQLTNQAMTMASGLFGLGSAGASSGYSSPVNNTAAQRSGCRTLSLLDQIGTANCDGMTDGTSNTNATNATNSNTPSIISSSVSSEIEYQEMNQRVSVAATEAIGAGNCTNSAMTDLRAIQTAANGTITLSNATVQALLAIQEKYDSTDQATQSAALADYNALAVSGALHTDTYNATFVETIDTVLENIALLKAQVGSCGSGGGSQTNDGG